MQSIPVEKEDKEKPIETANFAEEQANKSENII